jgi:phosphohistidine phosphatase
MKLYLVRHGEPKTESEDPSRSLTEKGIDDIERLSAFIAEKKNVGVDAIFHSGKLRAQQTAEILAKHLNPRSGVEKTGGLMPLDDPSMWAERLEVMDEDVMLVGHLPYMSRLASELLAGDSEKTIVEFPTGGMACLERDESGKWVLEWVVDPHHL